MRVREGWRLGRSNAGNDVTLGVQIKEQSTGEEHSPLGQDSRGVLEWVFNLLYTRSTRSWVNVRCRIRLRYPLTEQAIPSTAIYEVLKLCAPSDCHFTNPFDLDSEFQSTRKMTRHRNLLKRETGGSQEAGRNLCTPAERPQEADVARNKEYPRNTLVTTSRIRNLRASPRPQEEASPKSHSIAQVVFVIFVETHTGGILLLFGDRKNRSVVRRAKKLQLPTSKRSVTIGVKSGLGAFGFLLFSRQKCQQI